MSNNPNAKREHISLGRNLAVEGKLSAQSLVSKGSIEAPRSFVQQITSNTTAVDVDGSDCHIRMFTLPATGNAIPVTNASIKLGSVLNVRPHDLAGTVSLGTIVLSGQADGAVTITLGTVVTAGTDPVTLRLLVQ